MLRSRSGSSGVLGCEMVAMEVPWGSRCGVGRDGGASPGRHSRVVGNPRVVGCEKQ